MFHSYGRAPSAPVCASSFTLQDLFFISFLLQWWRHGQHVTDESYFGDKPDSGVGPLQPETQVEQRNQILQLGTFNRHTSSGDQAKRGTKLYLISQYECMGALLPLLGILDL